MAHLLNNVVRRWLGNRRKPLVQDELDQLKHHLHRLALGGGMVLTLVVGLSLAVVIATRWRQFQANKQGEFDDVGKAIQMVLTQRDVGYVRSLNMAEYAWRRGLVGGGPAHHWVRAYIDGGERLVASPDSESPALVAIGSGTAWWPHDRLAHYLGLAGDLAVIIYTSMPGSRDGQGRSAYFCDPSGSFFVLLKELDHTSVGSGDARDRANGLARLKAPCLNTDSAHARWRARYGNEWLIAYDHRIPWVETSFGKNPLSGEPVIIRSFSALDGDESFGRFVVFEPTEQFIQAVRGVTSMGVSAVDAMGRVVFTTEGTTDGEEAPGIGKIAASAGKTGSEHEGRGGFTLETGIQGTDWTLIHRYTWWNVAQELGGFVATACVLASIVTIGLWWLLLLLRQRIFLPAMVRAKRVYQSEVINRSLIEMSPVGLCLIDASDGSPVLENELARSYAESRHPNDEHLYQRLLEGYEQAKLGTINGGNLREFHLTLPGAFGHEEHCLLVMALSTSYQDRKVLLCALHDLTDRIAFENTLSQARKDAESASQAKSAFLAMMSHEIRTPLSGILGHLELLDSPLSPMDRRERLDRVRHSANSLLTVVNDVLDFSKIEAGQLDIEMETFSLRSLVERVLLLFAPSAQSKGISLHFRIDEELGDASYQGALLRIEQVLHNLLSNAVKFTHSGRVAVHVFSVGEVIEGRQSLRFRVIDSGIGLAPSQKSRLFEPFSQAESSISRRFGGTGLGLSLCRRLSVLLGGSISVESTLGIGSAFDFDVPLAVVTSATDNSRSLQGERVVLLSSVADWRYNFGRLVAALGATTRVITHPDEWDEAWEWGTFTLLVVDRPWGAWSESAECGIGARRIVWALQDGPLSPIRDGDCWFVTCFSADAVCNALRDPIDDKRAAVEQAAVKRPGGSKGRILLIDDHPTGGALVCEQLTILGYEVELVASGEEALQRWCPDAYVAVLTDYHMPGMDGVTLSRALRERGAMEPILMLTASVTSRDTIDWKSDITEVLRKPLPLRDLDHVLSSAIARSER